jgi:hypothetical protein
MKSIFSSNQNSYNFDMRKRLRAVNARSAIGLFVALLGLGVGSSSFAEEEECESRLIRSEILTGNESFHVEIAELVNRWEQIHTILRWSKGDPLTRGYMASEFDTDERSSKIPVVTPDPARPINFLVRLKLENPDFEVATDLKFMLLPVRTSRGADFILDFTLSGDKSVSEKSASLLGIYLGIAAAPYAKNLRLSFHVRKDKTMSVRENFKNRQAFKKIKEMQMIGKSDEEIIRELDLDWVAYLEQYAKKLKPKHFLITGFKGTNLGQPLSFDHEDERFVITLVYDLTNSSRYLNENENPVVLFH